MRNFRLRTLGIAVALHALIFLAAREIELPRPRTHTLVSMTVEDGGVSRQRASSAGMRPKKHAPVARPAPPDLRPTFVKDGTLFAAASRVREFGAGARVEAMGEPGDSQARDGVSRTQEVLNASPRVNAAFDRLAAEINHFLDYPPMLLHAGIEGTATLELVFDGEGEVDEGRSRFFGNHRAIRGLLTKASREGLKKWYLSASARLDKRDFRNQTFRAEFFTSIADTPFSGVVPGGDGFYRLLRRRRPTICGTDVICLAHQGFSAAERALSDNYRVQIDLLQDRLSEYDQLGLAGIRGQIRKLRERG